MTSLPAQSATLFHHLSTLFHPSLAQRRNQAPELGDRVHQAQGHLRHGESRQALHPRGGRHVGAHAVPAAAVGALAPGEEATQLVHRRRVRLVRNVGSLRTPPGRGGRRPGAGEQVFEGRWLEPSSMRVVGEWDWRVESGVERMHRLLFLRCMCGFRWSSFFSGDL